MRDHDSQALLTVSEAAAVGIGGALAAVSGALTVFCFGVWIGLV